MKKKRIFFTCETFTYNLSTFLVSPLQPSTSCSNFMRPGFTSKIYCWRSR